MRFVCLPGAIKATSEVQQKSVCMHHSKQLLLGLHSIVG